MDLFAFGKSCSHGDALLSSHQKALTACNSKCQINHTCLQGGFTTIRVYILQDEIKTLGLRGMTFYLLSGDSIKYILIPKVMLYNAEI